MKNTKNTQKQTNPVGHGISLVFGIVILIGVFAMQASCQSQTAPTAEPTVAVSAPTQPQPTSDNTATEAAPAQTGQALEVSVDEAAQLREQGAFMLDVRQPDEWAQGHIPDATLIPLGELPTRLSEVPTDKQVVVVCRSGRRSAEGRDILLKAGYTQVTSMAGGMNAWQSAALPIATGK